jgi:hypothetical protein
MPFVIDASVAACDLLLMKAPPMPEADASAASIVKRAFEMITTVPSISHTIPRWPSPAV